MHQGLAEASTGRPKSRNALIRRTGRYPRDQLKTVHSDVAGADCSHAYCTGVDRASLDGEGYPGKRIVERAVPPGSVMWCRTVEQCLRRGASQVWARTLG